MKKQKNYYTIVTIMLLLIGISFLIVGVGAWESKYTLIGACLCWSWLPIGLIEMLVKEIKG